VAFDGYVFGRPKIDRIIARVFTDQNVALTNVMSGEVEFAAITALRLEQLLVLSRQWNGVVHFAAAESAARNAVVQFRPEYQRTPALLDVRVRRAMNHAIDRQALVDGLLEGQGPIAWTPVAPDNPYFADVDRVIAKYPYDPRRTEQLMNEAGLFKDADGLFASATGQRFRPDFQVLEGVVFEKSGHIMKETWERAGIPTEYSVLPNVQSRDPMTRNTFLGIGGAGGNDLSADRIGTPQNRWSGSNRGGYFSPDYEALWGAYNRALDRSERKALFVEMAKFASEQLPMFMLYFDYQGIAHPAPLHGPNLVNPWWSIHAWEYR
jgi:peptide/nickel transport system substrate-binding protein